MHPPFWLITAVLSDSLKLVYKDPRRNQQSDQRSPAATISAEIGTRSKAALIVGSLLGLSYVCWVFVGSLLGLSYVCWVPFYACWVRYWVFFCVLGPVLFMQGTLYGLFVGSLLGPLLGL